MAWYRNHYHCGDCGTDWEDEWSCCCDDECPLCGSRNWSPVRSEDLSAVVEWSDGKYIALLSPPKIEDDTPRYMLLGRFDTVAAADSAIKEFWLASNLWLGT